MVTNFSKLKLNAMKYLIIRILLLTFMFSCGAKTDKSKIEDKDAQKESAKWKTLNSIASDYGAVAGFDTLAYSLSFEYQDILAKNNKIVLDEYRIYDIIKNDSIYVVSIITSGYAHLFLELTCDISQVEELVADAPRRRYMTFYSSNGKAIVAKIASINKVKFQNIHESYENHTFILKGQLIGILREQSTDR